MKLFGIVLTAATICITGNYFSRQKIKRISILENFVMFIKFLRTQIEFSKQPVEKIIEQAVDSGEFESCGFLKLCLDRLKKGEPLQSAWKSSADCFLNRSPITVGDCRTLKDFSNLLGSSDTGGQMRNCDTYIGILQLNIETLKKSADKSVKIINTLSLFAAAFVIIFFI